jgi:hypothetical protein
MASLNASTAYFAWWEEAVTTDGEWAFERIEEPGTLWIVVYHPHTPEAETVSFLFGMLQRAAHERGEHETASSPYGCRACDDRRWAR